MMFHFLTENSSVTASKVFITYALMFIFGCLIGYALEVLFRRLFTAHKFVNPGFMKGPWLPLYGCGLVLMSTITYLIVSLLPDSMVFYNPLGDLYGNFYRSGPTINDLLPISLMAISLILLEFIAGLIFVKGFKVRLWDYSNMKGNILGVICPLFSLVWLAVSVIYYYALNPFINKLFINLFTYLFDSDLNNATSHFLIIFFLGVVYGVFLIDLIVSLDVFRKITSLAKKLGEIVGYEKIKASQKEALKQTKAKFLKSIPDDVLKSYTAKKEASIERTNKFIFNLRKIFLIDPKKNSTENNYDKDGRPLKVEDETSTKEKKE